MLSVLEIKAKV